MILTKTYDEILESMQASYRKLSGFEADSASDIGIRLQVLAQQVALLYERAGELGLQMFPQTSTGGALERHAQCRGLARKPALPATGTLRFSREAPASADIPIAAGLVCCTRTEPPVSFTTTAEAVLPAGATTVDVPAVAAEPGQAGNVGTGAVCLMVSAAPGMTAVANPQWFSGGVDEEDDEALRARLLRAYRNISNGTNAAYYYDIAMQHEHVVSAAVLPRRRGRGTVDVVVSCALAAQEADAVRALQAELAVRKEVNVDVLVTAAKQQYVGVKLGLEAAYGYDYNAVADACMRYAMDYTAALGVGEPLLAARLTAALVALDGVYNVRVLLPSEDLVAKQDQCLRADSVSVTRLGT